MNERAFAALVPAYLAAGRDRARRGGDVLPNLGIGTDVRTEHDVQLRFSWVVF